ncbi:1-acyl-sn-glycerol-3-phosphate acyltransferase [Paraburkholderia xenovorans]
MHSLVTRALRTIVRPTVLRLFRVHATYTSAAIDALGRGRVIVCANHVSLLDGVLIALVSPSPLVFGVDPDFSRRSPIAMRGMATLAWMGFGRIVPIDARSPFGIRALAKALEAGENVMLFPEGRIAPTGARLVDQPGATWLCHRTSARIVWASIAGAERSRLFAKAGRELWPRITIRL